MNTHKWLTGFVVAVVIIAGYFVFSTVKTPSSNTPPIKIGVIIALTGNYEDVGQRIKEGVDLALSDLRQDRSNLKFEVIYEDGKSDPKTSIAAYRKLVDADSVDALIVAHSNVALAIAPLAQQDKIPLIAIYAPAPDISQQGDYVFRNDINLVDEMKKLSALIFSRGYKNLGLFYVVSDGAIASIDEFKKDFSALGGTIVSEEKYNRDETDYRTYLVKIKASNPDAIMTINSSKQLGLVINQARILGLNKQFFSDWHAEGIELLNGAKNNANGLVYSHSFDLFSQDETVRAFVASYTKTYSKEADYRSALAYDTVMLIANAAGACSTPESGCLKSTLSEIKDLKMVTGITTIDQNGDTAKNVIIKTVKDGQFVTVPE